MSQRKAGGVPAKKADDAGATTSQQEGGVARSSLKDLGLKLGEQGTQERGGGTISKPAKQGVNLLFKEAKALGVKRLGRAGSQKV